MIFFLLKMNYRLGYNRIDDEGAKLLGQALQQNTSKSVTAVM